MRVELYDEVALLFHSEEKDIYLVQHMIKNMFCVKKIIRNKQDLLVYETLHQHPHAHLANVIDNAYSYDKTIVIEEFINGCTLDYQMSQRKLSGKEVASIMLQLFSAVSHIHAQQPPIIHRDIKPENILIYKGHACLIDFEIAKPYEEDGCDESKSGSVGYAAPEQYNGQSTPQSDIYALGVLLQEIVEASDDKAMLYQACEQVIERSLKWDLQKRYQTVEEMKEEFLSKYHYKKC